MADILMLDTDTASYIIRGDAPVVDALILARDVGQVCISAVTRAELRFGSRRKTANKKLAAEIEYFLSFITTVSWDNAAADEYAEVRFALEQTGRPIGPLDTMIAAHAKSINATLITNNAKHFRMVKGLKFKNWTQ